MAVDPPSRFQMLSLAPNSLGHIVPARRPAPRQPLEGGVTHRSRRKTVGFEPFLIPGVRRKCCKTVLTRYRSALDSAACLLALVSAPPLPLWAFSISRVLFLVQLGVFYSIPSTVSWGSQPDQRRQKMEILPGSNSTKLRGPQAPWSRGRP